MGETKSPTAILAKWVEGQHETVKGDIAGLVGWYLSKIMVGFPEDHYQGNRAEKFIDWIADNGDASYHDVAAKAIAVRGQIEYLIDQRGTTEGWKKARENVEWAIESARAEGKQDMVDFGMETLKASPEREAIWLAAAESWRDLKTGVLSNSSIDTWVRNQMFNSK